MWRKIFSRRERGRVHLAEPNQIPLEVKGLTKDETERLIAVIPRVRSIVDYREASLEDVVKTLEAVHHHEKYYIVYRLVLDGGIRLAHALRLLQNYQPERLIRYEGFARYSLGINEGTKRTWYAYMRPATADMLRSGLKATKVGVVRFLAKMRA